MRSSFLTNTVWYILLGIATVFELILVIHKAKRRSQTIAFFITTFGIALFVESTILIFMKSYTYYPLILKNAINPFDDVLAGNLFSQLSISATLLLAVVFDLKYYWYFIFGISYGLIEELFLSLGIYNHNWYQTWMTVTMFPAACWIIKFIYKKLIQGIKPIFYYGYILLGLFPLNIITLCWLLMLTGIQDMSYSVLPDPIMSRHFIVLVLFFILAPSIMLLYFSKMRLYWKALIIIIMYILYYIAYKLNFILIRDGWFIPVSTATICWMYLSTLLLDRLYSAPQKQVLKG